MGKFGENLISGLGSSIGSSVVGMGMNLLGGLFGESESDRRRYQEELMKKQFEMEKEKMNLQADINKNQAKYSQELAKDMWQSTGIQAQIDQLKNQGMNPALLYGQSGAGGGTTAGAGVAQGVQMGTTDAGSMGIQARQQALQERLVDSEIAKNLAEAGKIAGAESYNLTEGGNKYGTGQEVDKSTIALQGTLADLNSANADLARANVDVAKMTEDEKAAHIKLMGDLSQKAWQEAKQVSLNNEIKEATKESLKQQVYLETTRAYLSNIEALAGISLTNAQKEWLEVQRVGYWYKLQTERISAEASMKHAEEYGDYVSGQIEKWGADVKLGNKRFIKDCVIESINAAANLGSTISDFIPTKVWKTAVEQMWGKNKEGNWEMQGQKNVTNKEKKFK